jgi:hypothetical protein
MPSAAWAGSEIGVRRDDRFNGDTSKAVMHRIPYAALMGRSLRSSRNYMSRPLDTHRDSSTPRTTISHPAACERSRRSKGRSAARRMFLSRICSAEQARANTNR